MNRPIEFRVWDISHKCFLPNNVYALINSDFGAFGIMLKDWNNYREGEYLYPREQTFSQFTGLHDKNGKKIFENDLFQVANNVIYEIRWCNGGNSNHEWYGGCFVLYIDEENFYPMDEYAIENGEVIGNIFENKNLIEP